VNVSATRRFLWSQLLMTSRPKKPSGGADGDYLGRTLDERYRLDEVIGAGAIGKVYAGTQLAVDRKVAIKLLHPAIRDRELGKERFLREAKAVARLSHSSCLTLFDFGSDDDLGCFYMVTEFVEGTPLASEVQRGPTPIDRCYHVLYHAATALQHAHERGILHRDLKPENIMLVGEEGAYSSVKVLDFGLARIREGARQNSGLSEISEPSDNRSEETPNNERFGDSRLTNFGDLNGTPAYMSPEQCRGDLNLTPACDYYSLGVLAYELIEGRLPYESSAVQRVLAMHLNDPIPEMVSDRVPQPVEDMIYRLLAKNPTHRLQSAVEILDTLRPYVTVDPSREMSRATLERFRRETPSDGQSAEMPVAKSGAETLASYDDVDTPIPQGVEAIAADVDADEISRDSTFGTMLAADASQKISSKGRRRAVALAAGVLVLLVGAGTWWLTSTPESEPVAREESSASGQDARAEPPVEQPSRIGAGESAEQESGARALAEDDLDEEAPSVDVRPKQPVESGESGEAKQAPSTPLPPPEADEDKDRQRPRKLKLTY
jgi:serine/threonine-protein kinase